MAENRDENRAEPKSSSLLARLKPKAIDWYILQEVVAPFAGSMIFLIFVLLMFQILKLASAFIEHAAPLVVLLKIIGFMIVVFLPIVLPLAFLMSVLTGFGRLSTDNELVALKAHGVSTPRMTFPVIGLGVLVSLLVMGLNFDWAPSAKFAWRSAVIQLTNTSPTAAIKEKTFTTGFFGLLIYAEYVDPDTNRLGNVFMYDERNPQAPRAIIAPSGRIVPVKVENDLGSSVSLELYNGEIHSNDASTATYQKSTFREYKVHLVTDPGAANAVSNFMNLRYPDLVKALATVDHPVVRNQIRTEICARWLLSLIPFIFVFIGIGLGTARARSSRSGVALVTLAIILPTYILQTVCQNLGYSGALPPFLAMLIPDLILGSFAFYVYRRAAW